ncbi:hypothetical protein, partial [uncultured Helicobacter sp.]|uniref:hypothetical protein n=2 Tax=uncultured Helicobacter sp. TaxID=175537 RepID=UPI003752D5AB
MPQANCNKMIESSLIDKKGASPSGVNEILTPNDTLDSKKDNVCARSGVSGDSLSTSDSKSEALAIKINKTQNLITFSVTLLQTLFK